jgi:predicted nucleotidyltransferase
MVRLGQDYEEQIAKLKEREKELKCLYKMQGIIDEDLPVEDFLQIIIKHLWGGWQYPNITRVKISFEGKVYKESGWDETEWVQYADIIVDDEVLGKIEVYYTQFKRLIIDSQFLPEEQKLLNTIATKIGNYIFKKRLNKTLELIDAPKNQEKVIQESSEPILHARSDVHWKWRYEIVNTIAERLDMERFGVKAFYLIGSTKNATAGPGSDIDLLIHINGNKTQEHELKAWIEGWSYCLSEMNLLKTGYKSNGLIDLHLVTDEDIRKKTSFAIMIGAVTDGARLIKKN